MDDAKVEKAIAKAVKDEQKRIIAVIKEKTEEAVGGCEEDKAGKLQAKTLKLLAKDINAGIKEAA